MKLMISAVYYTWERASKATLDVPISTMFHRMKIDIDT